MNTKTRQKIEKHLIEVMEKLIKKRVIDEPFNKSDIERKNPFGYRLVPVAVWKGSKFERSFVTTLGQRIFEQIGKYVAEGTGAIAENQYRRDMEINTWRIEKIDSILKMQRSSKKSREYDAPSIKSEIDEILALENDRYEKMSILSDLYIKRPDGKEEFYSFKTVKPNLDQTEKAKKEMLLLMASDETVKAYFGLPYNPAGEGNSYRKIHGIPYRLFNMDDDEYVLIGSDLWNKIGQDDNTYSELLNIFEDVGNMFNDRIKKEYFGL